MRGLLSRCALPQVRGQLDPNFAGGRPLRIAKIRDGTFYDVLETDVVVHEVDSSYWDLRAEPVPDDDVAAVAEAGLEARRLVVGHFVDEQSPTHYGEPLAVMLRPQEQLGALKARFHHLIVTGSRPAEWRRR